MHKKNSKGYINTVVPVTGWVDAQNGFGATLRNSYTVKIEFASSDTYTVKECTVS